MRYLTREEKEMKFLRNFFYKYFVYPLTLSISCFRSTPKEKSLVKFSCDDKINILNIIRPIVKRLNSDESYINICNLLEESKKLKTFSSLSEDEKTLTINLTQSPLFNSRIADFIKNYVSIEFKATIDTESIGDYTVESKDGSIIIQKIG